MIDRNIILKSTKKNPFLLKHFLHFLYNYEWIEIIKNNDVIVLDHIKEFSEIFSDFSIDEETLSDLISYNDNFIKIIEKPTEKIQVQSIENNPKNIKHINNPNLYVKTLSISLDPECIQYIKNPSPLLQKMAVYKQTSSIQYIKKPCEQLVKYALDEGVRLDKIYNPSKKMKKYAVNASPINIAYIKNPSNSLKKMALLKDMETAVKVIKDLPKYLQIEVMKKDPNLFKHINNPYPEVIEKAIKFNYKNIHYLHKKNIKEYYTYQKLAISQSAGAIYLIENPLPSAIKFHNEKWIRSYTPEEWRLNLWEEDIKEDIKNNILGIGSRQRGLQV